MTARRIEGFARRCLPDAVFERLLVFLASASFAGVLLGWLGLFSSVAVLLVAGAATWAYARRVPSSLQGGLPAWQVLLVLAVALVLRLPPADHPQGGQDQGVYTAMGSELLRTGSLLPIDHERPGLAARGFDGTYRRDNYTLPFLPGVYDQGETPPRLRFQFYHVFPVWLALGESLFGGPWSGLALTFLALASVLFFQWLAALLGGRAGVGFAAGLLLALNPLHVLFSRFPVTEVPALAFSAAGFAFVLRYALAETRQRRPRWLVLSVVAFLGFFLTRISGFMYLPLLGLAAVAALCCDADRARAQAVAGWAAACVAAYAASVAYGLVFSRPYALEIYRASFSLLAGRHWPWAVGGLALAGAAAWAWTWRHAEAPVARRIGEGLVRARRLIAAAMGLVLVLGAWKAWRLGFTDAFAANAWLARFPGIVGAGWFGVAHASLVVVAAYLSPWLLLWLPVAAWRRVSAATTLLAFFVACFLAYAAFLNWTVVYQPYYARYFCSELVPYGLLLAVVAAAASPRRRLAGALLVATGLWFAGVSALQWGPSENAGARASIGRLAAVPGDRGVLLLDNYGAPSYYPKEIKSALVYVFGRHVVSIGDRGLADLAYLQALSAEYDTVYFASPSPHPPPGFVPVATLPLRAVGFVRGPWPPHARAPSLEVRLHVSRLASLGFEPGRQRRVDVAMQPGVRVEVGRRQSARGVVADGRPGLLVGGPALDLPAGTYSLEWLGEGAAADELAAWTQVLDANSANVLALVPRPTSPGALASLRFQVPADGRREVRLVVPAGTGVAIRAYALRRLY